MAILSDFKDFSGQHYETGMIRDALVYQGVITPHTGKPISEALLLGVSGGVTVGYFTFEYTGYRPWFVLLTRNTFDPMDTIFERLAIPRDVAQTSSSDKGEDNLHEALEGGRPAIVWADMFTLPYNHMQFDDNNWAMRPLLVYGLENGKAYLNDRANCPIIVDADVLNLARGRIAKDKFRVMTLDVPDMNRLPGAVSKGIWQCISLYTDAPPKGKRNNFGLAALQHWAKMLTNTRNKHSWARYFPPGERLWMALAGDTMQQGAYGWILNEAGNYAERGMYADFLDEAALILEKPGLKEAGDLFRKSEAAWRQLNDRLLPADVSTFKETADLLISKRTLFNKKGAEAMDEITDINSRLTALRKAATKKFPLSDAEVTTFQEGLAEQLLTIHDIERDAVACMQSVMA